MLAPSGYKHFSPNQLQQEKIKFLKSYNLPPQEIQTFLNSAPNSRNVQILIKKLQLKPYEQQFLQYQAPTEPVYKKHINPVKPYISENIKSKFLKYLNEFELEGEHQSKPLWNGIDYIDDGGDINLRDMNLTELPCIFPEKWSRGFYCDRNKLTSLKGCPEVIGGSFNCSRNSLRSLEGGPKEVGVTFNGAFNPAKFTREDVQKVCKVRGNILE